MKSPDITSLRLFVAMCEHQNISAAARQENITPSAASKRIAQIAHDVNAQLFERRRRGVELTPAGRTLLAHAHTILYTIDRIHHDIAAEKGGVRGHVRLLVSQSVLAKKEVPADVAAFMRSEENFNVRVDIEQMLSDELVQTIREGSTAVGICWDYNDLAGLQLRPYRGDVLALAVHRDHLLASRTSIRFEETLDYEHAGQRPGGTVHMLLGRAAVAVGRTLVYRAIVASFEAALCVVAANLAVSIIPRELAGVHDELCFIPLEDPWARRQFALCFRELAALEPAARKMVEFLAARAGSEVLPQ